MGSNPTLSASILSVTRCQHAPHRGLRTRVRKPHRLFKLHGSTNWGRQIDREGLATNGSDTGPLRAHVARRLAEDPASKVIGDVFVPFREGMDFGVSPYVPAIAVPIADKDEFECPPAQVDRLAGLIEHVDRVLVIGWKGAETRFLSILASVPEGVPFDIVGQDGVHRVAHNLRASGVNADYRVFNGGFSGFGRVAARIDGLPSHLDHFIEPLPVDAI